MKVLMLVTFPEFGGTETHVLYLARELQNQGVQIGVATCGGPFVPHFSEQGISVHHVRRPKQSSIAKTVNDIVEVVNDEGYDIVHAHDFESFRMLPLLREELPDTPFVMTVHALFYSKNILYRAGTSADRVIVVSPMVRKRVIDSGVEYTKITWIPNGIDTAQYIPTSNTTSVRRILGLPQKKKILLYCGRFQSDKWGVAKKVILAAEPIARRDSQFIAVLVGFGSYRTALSNLAKRINRRIGRRAIYVLPPTTHIELYYRAATLVVGTGRVALEAMACGKPVVAAGYAGYVGIVSPKTLESAISNHFGDHAAPTRITTERLTGDIKVLLLNQKRGKNLGNYGREVTVKRFSIRQMADLTYRLYSGEQCQGLVRNETAMCGATAHQDERKSSTLSLRRTWQGRRPRQFPG